jgi:protein-disulfide isomerase
MKNKFFIAAIVFLIVLGGVLWSMKDSLAPSAPPSVSSSAPQSVFAVDHSLLIREHAPVLGPANAPITIVEFLDPECEACRAMYPITKKVMAEFPNQVRLVIRYMPFHQNSLMAANILEEARAQGKYWEALELLFKRQPEWADHHDPKPDQMFVILSQLKLKNESLQVAARDGKYTAQIKQDEDDGKRLGVRRTPTFFINGKILEEMGEQPLRDAIANSLK